MIKRCRTAGWFIFATSIAATCCAPYRTLAGALATIAQTVKLDWRDQCVIAARAAYDLDAGATIYVCYNYGRNPVSNQAARPLVPSVGERHLTAGARMRLSGGWSFSGAFEYLFLKKVTYDNPEVPFRPGARQRGEYIAAHLMLSTRW